ncbi:MAG: PDZ domain-containing protein [Chloroflexi bacterium]|nr:PDZ domain-containing protein [Chloroflexota bacterium]
MVRISGQRGVPVTVIDGQVVVGFDRRRLDALLATLRRPRLGAAVADAADMAAKGRTSLTQGAYVGMVHPGSPAERAGLQPGDVIIALGGRPVSNASALERMLAEARPGTRLSLTFVRGSERRAAELEF